jgi:excisionase family DNA binding protein
MCTSEILSKLTTIENLLKKLISFSNTETSEPITFKEACVYLGYAPSYLYKLTYKKLIPHYKPTGKMIFFSKSELDEWIFKGSDECRVTNDELKEEKITERDPNQLEMELQEDDPSTSSGHEIVIEFPLKSRRKKSNQ